MNKVSNVERQLYILSLLSANKKGYTLQEITDAMGRVGIDVTYRMVSRDIDYISANFFVYEEVRDRKTYYKADKYGLEDIDFSVSQIIALYFNKEVLSAYKHLDLGKSAAEIIDKILLKLPSLSQTALKNIGDLLKITTEHSGDDDVDYSILDVIKEGAEKKNTVIIEYVSFNQDKREEREFAPYVIEVREGCYHTIGKCYLRNAVRDFRVSRILSAKHTQNPFEVPENFYEEYKKTRFDKLAGDTLQDIEIEFSGFAKKLIKEYDYYKADSLEEHADKLIFYKRAAISQDLISFVLSFGENAKVVKPEALKEKIANIIHKMGYIYKD